MDLNEHNGSKMCFSPLPNCFFHWLATILSKSTSNQRWPSWRILKDEYGGCSCHSRYPRTLGML